MKSSPTLFATLALGAAAAAQNVPAPPTEFTNTEIDTISLELSGYPTFKRIVAGTLLADGSQHALILADTQIVFLYQPAFSASAHLLSGAANDLDVAPGVVGGHDGFVTVGGAGLSLYAFDPQSGAFASAVVSNSTKWVNAKRVRAADINATGTVDYVGVGSNSRTIVVRRDVSGVATESEFNPNLEINDLFLMQWDFDSNLEIAVLDTSGLHVYEFTGTTAASYSGNVNGAITKFRVLGDSRDRIAWLADAGGGVQQLREVSKRNPSPVVSIPEMLDADHGFVLASADSYCASFGGPDGYQELVIMREADYSPLVLHNLAAEDPDPNFTIDPNSTPPHHGYLEGGSPALQEIAGPARKPILYKDLGGDGYPDLLIPVVAGPGSQKIEFWRGAKPLSAAPAPTLLSADLSPLTGSPTQRSLTVEVNTNLAEAGHNCVEVILWRQPYGGAPMRTGLVHRYYALPELLGYKEFTVDFQVAQSGDCFSEVSGMENVFWLEVRFAYQASGVISNPSDSSIAFLCTHLGTVDALTNYPIESPLGNLCLPSTMPPNGSACELRGLSDGCWDWIGNTLIRTPSLVKRLRIPPSGNSIPQPGQLNAGSWNVP